MTGSGQVGRANSSLIALFGIGVLLLIAMGMRGCWFHGFGFDFLGNPLFRGWRFSPYSLLGLGGLLQIALAVWVGYDAHRRGLNGFLWGLLVLFTFVVGLIVYLIVGPSMSRREGGPFGGDWVASTAAPNAPAPAATAEAVSSPASTAATDTATTGETRGHACPHCDAPVQTVFKICPYCAGTLRCPSCDGALQKDWKVCPLCGTTIPRRA